MSPSKAHLAGIPVELRFQIWSEVINGAPPVYIYDPEASLRSTRRLFPWNGLNILHICRQFRQEVISTLKTLKKERPSTYASPEDLETVYVDSPHPKSFCAELRRLRHHRAALASGFWRPTPVPRSISDPPSFCGAIERIILPYRCVSDQWAQVDYLFRFLDILNNVTNFSILFGPTWTRPTNETVPCVSSLVRFERIDTNVEPEVEVDDGLLIDLDGDLPFDLQVGIDAYAAFGSWDDQRIDPSGGPEGEPVWQGIDFDYVRMK